MQLSRHQLIRDALLASEDGLKAKELAAQLNTTCRTIRKAVKNVWGVYIDRWDTAPRGQYSAVYMCVPIPENAPHPTARYTPTQKGIA